MKRIMLGLLIIAFSMGFLAYSIATETPFLSPYWLNPLLANIWILCMCGAIATIYFGYKSPKAGGKGQ